MSSTRKVFKTPLCPNCTRFINILFQDGQRLLQCTAFESPLRLAPENLATECSQYTDKLKNEFWEFLEEQTREIPIIGQKKHITAGFKPQERPE